VTDEHRSFFNFRNTIVLLGVVITTIALVYFATAFAPLISEWGRVLDFFLLAVTYTSLGLHFASIETTPELAHARGWRWLRTTTAFYLLGLVSGGATIIAFLNVDAVSKPLKLLVVVVLGLALILVAATRVGKGPGPSGE
jgi:hypothetical protein